jgi:GTPase Era involved in 16S rRNA processing
MNFSTEEIINKPIIATIRWANAFNFMIIDIPGIIATTGSVTEVITKEYLREPNTIILCVLPADVDYITSRAYVITKEVDPKFERTIFIRTKFDLLLNNPG